MNVKLRCCFRLVDTVAHQSRKTDANPKQAHNREKHRYRKAGTRSGWRNEKKARRSNQNGAQQYKSDHTAFSLARRCARLMRATLFNLS